MRMPRWFFGEPMEYIAPAFVDQVSGKQVNYYRDGERYWMAHSPRSLYRTETKSYGRFERPDWLEWAKDVGRRM